MFSLFGFSDVRIVVKRVIVFIWEMMFFDFCQIDNFKALSDGFIVKSIVYDDEIVVFYRLVKEGLLS